VRIAPRRKKEVSFPPLLNQKEEFLRPPTLGESRDPREVTPFFTDALCVTDPPSGPRPFSHPFPPKISSPSRAD